MCLVLHTAAYWLMLTVRDAIPRSRDLTTADFATLRLRQLKVAARVIETARRVRLAFAAACPEANTFRSLPSALWPSSHEQRGQRLVRPPRFFNAFPSAQAELRPPNDDARLDHGLTYARTPS